MRIANCVSYGCMFMTGIIRFSYLVGNFTVYFLFETFFLLGLIIMWVGAEGVLGPKMSTFVRTYFNYMDSNWGKGFNMIFWCLILLEKAEKGEEIMPGISICIAIIDILIGYADHIKELPATPWPDTRTEDEKKGIVKKKKTAKELNEEKKKIEKEKARKKIEQGSVSVESGKSDKSSSVSDDSDSDSSSSSASLSS